MSFNVRNAHERDSRLSFDAGSHTYRLAGHPGELTSVTTLVDGCFPAFDAPRWAAHRALQEGVTPEVILERWEREAQRARELGTAMHDRIERYYLGETADADTDVDAAADGYRLFRSFAAVTTLHPYRTEWRIYHEDYGVAGTLDFLERTPDGTFNIYDWKRSRKLVACDGSGRILASSRYGSTGLYPVNHLHDTPYWHYALQVSVYRFILQERYGIRVSGMRLGVFHPSYDRPWIISLPYLESEVRAILSSRLNAK